MILNWKLHDEDFRGKEVWIADSGFDADLAVQWNGQSWCYWPVDVLPLEHPLVGCEGFNFITPDTAKLAAQRDIDAIYRQRANADAASPEAR